MKFFNQFFEPSSLEKKIDKVIAEVLSLREQLKISKEENIELKKELAKKTS